MKYDINYKLYLVTEEDMPFEQLLPVIKQAVSGGVSLVQLRKKFRRADFYKKALELKSFLDTLSIPLIINDRVDVALAVGAAGVHVGQSDLPLEAVKRSFRIPWLSEYPPVPWRKPFLQRKRGGLYWRRFHLSDIVKT